MKNKIILILTLYAHLILLTNLNANVLEDIKEKKKEIKEEISLFKASDGQDVRRAISHENAGLVDQARLIFEQIFNAKKSSSYIFSNYKNFLIRREDWGKLIEISREYASSNKGNSNAKLALAESLLYVSGKSVEYAELENEGYKIIDNLILENLTDISKLTNLSKVKRYISRLIYYDKYELAILKINQIRNQYNYHDFYSKELGKYYLSNREYEQSLGEFILSLSNPKELEKYINNEFNSIRNQFIRFPEENYIKKIITKTLTRESSKIKNNILAEYKFNWGDYEEASELMIKNYFNEKSLYDFAINIKKESQFPSAEKIFNFLMNSNNSEMIELSILQLATILELKAKKEKIYLPISDRIIENSFLQLKPFGHAKINFKSDELSRAIIMYDSLITKYNNSRARFKIAEFKSITIVSYHESINDFIELEKSATDRSIKFQSAIKIIDMSIENGLIDNKLLSLIEKYKERYKNKNQEDYLNLKRYQILFYMKKFEELTTELHDKLKSLNKDNPIYNELLDGLTLMMLFNNKEDDLSLFCGGLLEIKKTNYPEAISKFNLLSKSKTEIVSNICSYYLAYIYINLNDYNLAKESLTFILGNDIFSEFTLLLSAELDDYVIKDINSAADRYMNFIDQFNSSIFHEEIRIRLEEIIG